MGMTKKPDEIKNGLECCIKSTCEPCCPYGNAANCKFAINLLEDVLVYIRRLEEDNNGLLLMRELNCDLHDKVERLETERDRLAGVIHEIYRLAISVPLPKQKEE